MNQSALASGLITPQKIQATKPVTPQTPQQRPAIQMPVASARTPINARSMPQAFTTPQPNPYPSAISPAYGIQSNPNLNYRRPLPQQATPFPIINQNQKSLFEKVVDYLINDGPSNRYGMICKECYGHNGKYFVILIFKFECFIHLGAGMVIFEIGMVSQEQYEYSAFKCAFCKELNPAKKLRPIAPRLPISVNAVDKKTVAETKTLQATEPSSSMPVSDKDSGKKLLFFQ